MHTPYGETIRVGPLLLHLIYTEDSLLGLIPEVVITMSIGQALTKQEHSRWVFLIDALIMFMDPGTCPYYK